MTLPIQRDDAYLLNVKLKVIADPEYASTAGFNSFSMSYSDSNGSLTYQRRPIIAVIVMLMIIMQQLHIVPINIIFPLHIHYVIM